MTDASDVLRACFHHHAWATFTLMDALETLPPERMGAETAGTYGSIARTLAHLVAADGRYLRRLAGERLPPLADDDGAPPLDELRAEMDDHSQRWTAFLDRVAAGALDMTYVPSRPDYPETPHAEGLLMVQALPHGNDHRTQICSTLGALGLEVPDLDGWTYWLEGRA